MKMMWNLLFPRNSVSYHNVYWKIMMPESGNFYNASSNYFFQVICDGNKIGAIFSRVNRRIKFLVSTHLHFLLTWLNLYHTTRRKSSISIVSFVYATQALKQNMYIKTHPRPAFRPSFILMPYTRSIFPRRAPISPWWKKMFKYSMRKSKCNKSY